MNESQLERHRRWQAIQEQSPETIERLPAAERSQVKRAIQELETQTQIENRQLALTHTRQMEQQRKLARREYIKHRSNVIAPSPSQSESSFSSEKPIQILIVVVSMVILGTSTANLARENGKEDLAWLAGGLGGGLIGFLAEVTGKKVFVDRYMADRYRIERKRLTEKKTAIQTKIQEISSHNC